jgi:hypothetical protein
MANPTSPCAHGSRYNLVLVQCTVTRQYGHLARPASQAIAHPPVPSPAPAAAPGQPGTPLPDSQAQVQSRPLPAWEQPPPLACLPGCPLLGQGPGERACRRWREWLGGGLLAGCPAWRRAWQWPAMSSAQEVGGEKRQCMAELWHLHLLWPDNSWENRTAKWLANTSALQARTAAVGTLVSGWAAKPSWQSGMGAACWQWPRSNSWDSSLELQWRCKARWRTAVSEWRREE